MLKPQAFLLKGHKPDNSFGYRQARTFPAYISHVNTAEYTGSSNCSFSIGHAHEPSLTLLVYCLMRIEHNLHDKESPHWKNCRCLAPASVFVLLRVKDARVTSRKQLLRQSSMSNEHMGTHVYIIGDS